MIVTNHPRQLPAILGALPYMHKPEGSAIVLTVFYMAKAVHTCLHGAIAGYGVHLHAAGYQCSFQSVVLCKQVSGAFNHLLVVHQATFVVVKFKVGCEDALLGFKVLVIEGIEQQAVHMHNAVVQGLRYGCVGLFAAIAGLCQGGRSNKEKQNGEVETASAC